jgi:PPOX class probable F420-dependent enzyme
VSSLLQPDLRQFLERARPPLVATVSTVRADGRPHVVPVWYRLVDDAMTIWTSGTRVWVRALERDPRVAVSIHEDERPYRAVILDGEAEIVTADSDDVMGEAHRITERYVAPGRVAAYVAEWPLLRTLVTIHLTAIHSARV